MHFFSVLILSLLLNIGVANPANAQRWSSSATDDGVWFFADAAVPGRGIEFHCGGRSPQNRPFAENPIGEPLITPTNQIMLSIADELLDATSAPHRDAALVVDGRAFWLPEVQYSDFEGVHEQPLDINDPIFAALRKGRRVALAIDRVAGPSWALSGSSAAIREMALHCVPRWQEAAGPPLPFTSATRPAPPRQLPYQWSTELRADSTVAELVLSAPAAPVLIGCTRPNDTGLAPTDRAPILGPPAQTGLLSIAILTLALPPRAEGETDPLIDIWLGLDGNLFDMPAMFYGGDAAWQGVLDADDRLIKALGTAKQIRIFQGSEARGAFPAGTLRRTLDEMLTLCTGTDPWAANLGAPTAPDARTLAGLYTVKHCPSGPSIDPTAILVGDLDGDGTDDAVLDTSGLQCDGMRPFCGAAFCSAWVFLSSRGDAEPFDFLTIGVAITKAAGQPALELEYSMPTCSNPFLLQDCTAQTLVYRNGAMVEISGN